MLWTGSGCWGRERIRVVAAVDHDVELPEVALVAWARSGEKGATGMRSGCLGARSRGAYGAVPVLPVRRRSLYRWR